MNAADTLRILDRLLDICADVRMQKTAKRANARGGLIHPPRVLLALYDNGPLFNADLAFILGFSSSYNTILMGALRESGLIERVDPFREKPNAHYSGRYDLTTSARAQMDAIFQAQPQAPAMAA